MFLRFYRKFPEITEHFLDIFAKIQVNKKMFLVDEFKNVWLKHISGLFLERNLEFQNVCWKFNCRKVDITGRRHPES